MEFINVQKTYRLWSAIILALSVVLFGSDNCVSATSTSVVESDTDVIIVGAGLAGLSTAYRLKKEGKSFIILEMSPHIGGRIRTASYTENLSAEVGLEEF